MEAKQQLFDMKFEKMNPDDQIYITGWKDAIHFIRFEMMNNCDMEIINMKDANLTNVCYSIVNRFFNFIIESLEDKMDKKMDECIEYAKEQEELDELEDLHEMEEEYEDFDLIPPEDDDYDIPDPEWMECDNECASCSSDTCNHRTEDYQVVDDIYDPDAYLKKEVM